MGKKPETSEPWESSETVEVPPDLKPAAPQNQTVKQTAAKRPDPGLTKEENTQFNRVPADAKPAAQKPVLPEAPTAPKSSQRMSDVLNPDDQLSVSERDDSVRPAQVRPNDTASRESRGADEAGSQGRGEKKDAPNKK
jgi:hypothetical protein